MPHSQEPTRFDRFVLQTTVLYNNTIVLRTSTHRVMVTGAG
jgi:hypothetical protein